MVDLWQVYVSVTFRVETNEDGKYVYIHRLEREGPELDYSVTGVRKGSGKGLRARERARGKGGVPSPNAHELLFPFSF